MNYEASRLEMWAAGQQHQDRSGRGLVDQQIQQLQGRGVRPMQVFQDKEQRLMFGTFEEDGDKGFERFWR